VSFRSFPAPVRQFARTGAVLSLACTAAACDRVRTEEGPRVLELAHDTIQLEAGVRLHDVTLRREAGGEFHPSALQATQGDVIRFTADDMAGHAIAFIGAELDPAVRRFLDETGQLRGPPLISRGASWVITTENAPLGDYPFHCSTHAVRGSMTVSARRDD
jgi:plastocyanin